MAKSDEFHVILDALALTKQTIENDPTFQPWDDYVGSDDDDPKVTKAGYLGTIEAASATITVALEAE